MTLYGYARVSVREPEDKNLDLQMERLVRAGCSLGNIRAEEASGAKNDRGGLRGMPTQFSRAIDELGIQMIFALSPQAKGRVERSAGTFLDRLVTELRLAGASSIGEANRVLEQFLPRFN